MVRNVFVLMEATSYGFKRIALHQSEIYEVDFSPSEYALLKEEKYTLDNSGNAEIQDRNFQKFIPNLRFAYKCFAKAHGLSSVLDLSSINLKEFEELRNRITHPKQLSDLSISNEEIQRTEKVANWFMEKVSELIDESTSALAPLPVRTPKVTSRLNVTKQFFIILFDGNVYQSDDFDAAKQYVRSKNGKAILFRTEDRCILNVPNYH